MTGGSKYRSGRPAGTSASKDADTAAVARAAWLLRTSRIHSADPDCRTLSTFSRRLKLPDRRVDSPTLSRWETGAAKITYNGVRAYEDVLDLRSHSLVSVIDTIYRYSSSQTRAKPALTRRPLSDPESAVRLLNEFFEKGSSKTSVSGREWDDFSALVAQESAIVPVPRSAWSALLHRLMHEIICADGVHWMLRFEALNRLLAHPTIGALGVEALHETIEDRAVQSLVGTACLYDATAHRRASDDVVHYLEAPPDERVLKGVLMACVRKLHQGHFNAPDLTALSPLVADTITDATSATNEMKSLAIAILRAIPAHLQHRSSKSLLPKLLQNHEFRSVYQNHSLLAPGKSALVAQRVYNLSIVHFGRTHEARTDEMLSELVQEMLFHPVFDARLYASFLIYLSPYRASVAAALLQEVAANRPTEDFAWITTLFESLRILGGQREREAVQRYVVASGVADSVNDAAAYALGHIGGVSGEGFWKTAVVSYVDVYKNHKHRESILDRIVYAMGIQGHHVQLREILGKNHDVPEAVRRSARWWLDQPPHILRSAAS
ncbi:hypothetical protein ACIOD2_46840 [Amycolatopsis sp. NPDC088138]|uniref:hypothetical protein n=1 Tax=Amycolatopsis sp. NPDC088138 TaxID=3363938 RepID=UPI0037F62AFB